MRKFFTCLHVITVLSAYSLYGLLCLFPQIAINSAATSIPIVGCLGLLGFVTGLTLMALRKPGAESILLAVSTVAAFVAMMFGLCAIVAVR